MTLRIKAWEIATASICDRIAALRRDVYAGDNHYCPPFEGSLEREMSRPEFMGRQRIFMAFRDDMVVACAVVRRPRHLRLDGNQVATIGTFEARHDGQAVDRLLKHAVRWARHQGSATVIGPMDGDTWHKYRFNLGPRNERPFILEPYNPVYYPVLWREAGFDLLATYHSRRIDDVEQAAHHHRSRWEAARQAGFVFEAMSPDSLGEALDRVYDMVCVAFADNFLYTPIDRGEFKALYDGVDQLLDEDLSFFLVDGHGRDAGFSFVVADKFQALRAMRGKRHWWAKLKFLLHGSTDTANIKTFAIMPEFRGQGLASAMAHRYYRAIADRDFDRANICLIHDHNVGSIKMDGQQGRILRRYGLFITN